MNEARDLLFEIGCEELPSSFVAAALAALPGLAEQHLAALRLSHGQVCAVGTPRRLALQVEAVASRQTDLAERVVGPPVKVAFDEAGEPTRAAESFAAKVGCAVGELGRTETPKGSYLVATRRQSGRPAEELLGGALAALTTEIPFRKSMRWGSGALSFGRPVRWLVALFGDQPLAVEVGTVVSSRFSRGHRFLHPGAVAISAADGYLERLREAHVVADPAERAELMRSRLEAAAAEVGGTLIEDGLLARENLSLVEEPTVVVGSFEEQFLKLPEAVILAVARGHQRYFGLRGPDGALLPHYLAVVNTARRPDEIRKGNDRVMRARLADAAFFHREDLAKLLEARRSELGGVVFQARLGSVLDKVDRMQQLVGHLAGMLGAPPEVQAAAEAGARLCKCDLTTWMVGELPELQGEVGRAYAIAQGVPQEVADVIRDHYRPKSAGDDPPPGLSSCLVALADRLDTLVGCFGVGLSPTGTADPYGLRRACIGVLRILLVRDLRLSIRGAVAVAYEAYREQTLDADAAALGDRLATFFRDRLRGLLAEELPQDVVDAALAVAADDPVDARARARAIAGLTSDVRAQVGEVFKRAAHIAGEAPEGAPSRGDEPAEAALYDAYGATAEELAALTAAGDYAAALAALATLAGPMARFFDEVLVMADDAALRDNRLRLLRTIADRCGLVAKLELLVGQG